MLCYGALALSVVAMGFGPNHFTRVSESDPKPVASIDQLQSPFIKGTTLHIEGPIDSHIYDYLAYEARALKNVKTIELNSWGGNVDWALQIAQKIKDLGVDTSLREGDVCTSACVPLFAAGRHRAAAPSTWFGIQGAQLGVSYTIQFMGLCFNEEESGADTFAPTHKGCGEFLGKWSSLVTESTGRIFQSMESNGISPNLRQAYYALPDEKDWMTKVNVFKKPKWTVSAAEAVKYNLVTEIVEDSSPLVKAAQ